MKIPHIETVERDGVTYTIKVDYPIMICQVTMDYLDCSVTDSIDSGLKTGRYLTKDFVNNLDWVDYVIDQHITAHSKQSEQ